MGYVGRRRLLDERASTGTYQNGPTTFTYKTYQNGLEATSSQDNPGWLSYKRTGRKTSDQYMGSEFIAMKHEVDNGQFLLQGVDDRFAPGNINYFRVNGPVLPVAADRETFAVSPDTYGPNPSTGRMFFPSYPGLDAFGATAVSRCAPTVPHADLATDLAELAHDGLPSLTSSTIKGKNGRTFRGISSDLAEDNLKAQFELLPLVSSYKDVSKAIRRREYILRQYSRDSGRPVRRTYGLPTETTTTTQYENQTSGSGLWPGMNGRVWSSSGNITKRTTITVDKWFVGSFVYHRAGGDSTWNKLERGYQDMNHLVGLGLGPSTGWNLLPWSWAADYFTNIGDVMENVQMAMNDGLIMQYGYVMCTEVQRTEYIRKNIVWNSHFPAITWPTTLVASVTRTRKWRRKANPFGFGITYDQLNWRQMSILASLGITRTARVP